jgi:hypothetical protein
VSEFQIDILSTMLRVIFLDRGEGNFTVSAAGRSFEHKLTGSGRWQTAEFKIAPSDITVRASSDLTLHMIEVESQKKRLLTRASRLEAANR